MWGRASALQIGALWQRILVPPLRGTISAAQDRHAAAPLAQSRIPLARAALASPQGRSHDRFVVSESEAAGDDNGWANRRTCIGADAAKTHIQPDAAADALLQRLARGLQSGRRHRSRCRYASARLQRSRGRRRRARTREWNVS